MNISKWISKHHLLIIIISIILFIPAVIGYINTKINYDILVYLPDNIDTIKGQEILTNDFNLGSYAFVMTKKDAFETLNLEEEIKRIDGVNQVISIYDLLGTSIPVTMLPDEIKDKIYKEDETIIVVTFENSISDDSTIEAIRKLRNITNDKNNISSMTAMIVDTMDISNEEFLLYVVISVFLCLIVLICATDSYIIPILLLMNIGTAIIYNMGSNIFLGQISYITQAITAILQLGVTTDFSIFLYHKYKEEKNKQKDKQQAMSIAIKETFKSVLGSSLTTFAGFLALCTMELKLGTDIGIVMAKGVLCGLICVMTLFPALLLQFDKIISKTTHKKLLPEFKLIQKFSNKNYIISIIIFLILLIPAIIGNNKYKVYYKLDESLPKDLGFQVANSKLSEKYNIVSPQIIILDKNIKLEDINRLVNEINNEEGIDLTLSPSQLDENTRKMLPSSLENILANDKYQIIITNSKYPVASIELNNQIKKLTEIVKKYDEKGIIAGEGALMNDLVTIADHDFRTVNYTSIIVIFIIMLFVLKSLSLPVILIITIEFAIFLNMACAYFTNTELPFVASIVVGTIQLGATIDYAILMSNKYVEERRKNKKEKAIEETLKFSVPSIITSALCFFAATIGVALYTKIDMIGSICMLLARGSMISMLVVILILPAFLKIFDKFIKEGKNEK